MKKFISTILLIPIFALVSAQDFYPINDLPGAKASEVTTVINNSSREYTSINCDDLTQPISIALGLASQNPGSQERVGIQTNRLFRDAIPSTCANKAWPGIITGGPYGYHAIQFSNNSSGPVCITVNFNVDGGTSPCTVNAHALVYQSGDGLDPDPYDPTNQALNFLGDVGSSLTQPFSVTVQPGLFEVVFCNNFSVSQCDLSFNITVPPGQEGSISCNPQPVPVNNWTLLIAAIAIVVFTIIRFRK